MISINYYKLLELDSFAGIDDIKNQYKKLIKKHHPDKGGSEIKFIEVKHAYDYLLNNKKDIDENLFIEEQILEKCDELTNKEYEIRINDKEVNNLNDLIKLIEISFDDNSNIFEFNIEEYFYNKEKCNNIDHLHIIFKCHQCYHKNEIKIALNSINNSFKTDCNNTRLIYSYLVSLINSTIIVECIGCSLKFKINL